MSLIQDRFAPASFADDRNRGKTSREIARNAVLLRPCFVDPRTAREAELKRQPLLDEINRWNATTPIGRRTVCERSEVAS